MSEIGRYEFMCSHPGSVSRREDGPWITFVDHERDVSEKISSAVAAERKRCREDEVKPLKDFCEYMLNQENMAFAECSVAEDLWCRCRDALAAMSKAVVTKEKQETTTDPASFFLHSQ